MKFKIGDVVKILHCSKYRNDLRNKIAKIIDICYEPNDNKKHYYVKSKDNNDYIEYGDTFVYADQIVKL